MSTITSERAKPSASTMGLERVAMLQESIMQHERAIVGESTVYEERATLYESTIACERHHLTQDDRLIYHG